MHTVGRRLSDLDLRAGVAAQSAAAFLLWRAADFGFPISTTQVTTGAVLGSGSKMRWRGTRWSVAGHVVAAWVITLPCAAVVGAVYAEIAKLPGGTYIIYALVAAAVAGMLDQAHAAVRRLGGAGATARAAAAAVRRPTPEQEAQAPSEGAGLTSLPPPLSRRWVGSCTFRV